MSLPILTGKRKGAIAIPVDTGAIVTLSLKFDGIDDFLNCGNMNSLDGASQASWSWWVKHGDNTWASSCEVMLARATLNQRQFDIRADNPPVGHARVSIYPAITGSPAQWFSATKAFEGEVWTHLAAVFDGAQPTDGGFNTARFRFYKNGVDITDFGTFANAPMPAIMTTPTALSDLTIGAGVAAGGAWGSGNIDEVSIWAGLALTPAQVVEIYNIGTPIVDLNTLTFQSPTNWWRMGDGAVFPIIKDLGTPGGFDGTMINMSTANFSNDTPP